VIAPVLPGGIAVIGDPALYACAGDARVADVTADADGRGVTVTVLGAGERVRIVGYAERPVSARTWSPAAGHADVASTYDGSTRAWELGVDVGRAGWIKVQIRA
jgi:hypothetical protein